MRKWKKLTSNQVVCSPWMNVYKDRVELPNGIILDDFYKAEIRDAASIVALDEKQNILLKKEYRYCYDEDLIEIPAGIFEEGETASRVAERELLEETGYASKDWMYLGKYVESSAKLTNHMHIFFAENCKKISAQKLDATEDVELIVVPFQDAVDMVMHGQIVCQGSCYAILRVAKILEERSQKQK